MMMSNEEQLSRLFFCLGFGVLISLYYEIFHVWRHFSKPTHLRIFIQDVLFCSSAGTSLFLFSLAISGGELRAVMLLAVAVGFVAARVSIGRWFFKVICGLYGLFCRLCSPLKKITCFFQKKVRVFLKKGLHFFKRVVYNHKE